MKKDLQSSCFVFFFSNMAYMSKQYISTRSIVYLNLIKHVIFTQLIVYLDSTKQVISTRQNSSLKLDQEYSSTRPKVLIDSIKWLSLTQIIVHLDLIIYYQSYRVNIMEQQKIELKNASCMSIRLTMHYI